MLTTEHVETPYVSANGRRAPLRVTPTRLRMISIGLAVMVLLTGVITALTATERHSATATASQQSEALVVRAQAIDTYLSDADTTAAGSFLQGQIQPSALRSRYEADLARASSSLAEAAQGNSHDNVASASITTMSVDIPIYSGLIQTATFNERQAYYPIAAAYLGEANSLMQTTILPAAQRLYVVENQQLSNNLHTAQEGWLLALAAALLAISLILLVVVQIWMSRRFRRTLNLWLLGATAATVVLGAWFAGSMIAQSSRVNAATTAGSAPLVVFTQARIGALRMAADDELTLLTRDSEPGYQPDFHATEERLQRLLKSAGSTTPATERREAEGALEALGGYNRVHRSIRRLDGSGAPNLEAQADAEATKELPAASSTLAAVLGQAIGTSQQRFGQSATAATSDMASLIWASIVFSLLAAVLVLAGFRPRISEYR